MFLPFFSCLFLVYFELYITFGHTDCNPYRMLIIKKINKPIHTGKDFVKTGALRLRTYRLSHVARVSQDVLI